MTSPDSQCLPAKLQRSVPAAKGRSAITASYVAPYIIGRRLSDMPPSTATHVETFRLTVWTVYSVTVEFATSARPGSSNSRLSAPSDSCTAPTIASTYSATSGGCCWPV